MPLLPGHIEIINADIDLDIAQILLKLVDISGVSLAAKIRDGKLQRSPFETRIGSAGYRGYLDPATAETGVVFEYAGDDDTAGGVMDKLPAAQCAGSAATPLFPCAGSSGKSWRRRQTAWLKVPKLPTDETARHHGLIILIVKHLLLITC